MMSLWKEYMISFRFAVGFVFAFVAAFAALSANAAVEVLTLSSGEKIAGEIGKEVKGKVAVKTPYGVLNIPVSEIASREVAKNLVATPDGSMKVASIEQPKPAAKPAPAPETAPTPEEKDPQWAEDYRNFVETYFPDGWQFRLRGGLEFRKTDSSVFSFHVSFDVKKEWDVNILTATAYYNYTTQKSSAGVEDVTIDNYGVDTMYKRFFNETKTWYIANLLSYKHDQVKSIRHQVDESITFGYRFDFKRHNLVIDIGPGPAVRYTESSVSGTDFVAIALLQEDLNWIISKTFRFEQGFVASLDLNNTDKYAVYFKMALVAHLTRVMDLALRYSYQYDNISSSTVTTEQRLILAFEFPFNWK